MQNVFENTRTSGRACVLSRFAGTNSGAERHSLREYIVCLRTSETPSQVCKSSATIDIFHKAQILAGSLPQRWMLQLTVPPGLPGHRPLCLTAQRMSSHPAPSQTLHRQSKHALQYIIRKQESVTHQNESDGVLYVTMHGYIA